MPDDDHLDDPDDPCAALADADCPLGEIVPDALELDKIPRRFWEQTLARVPFQMRFYVAQRIPDQHLRELAIKVVMDLDIAESLARRSRDALHGQARRIGAPLPAPDVGTRGTAQLNMRLRRDDYERLREAATTVGMKPTTLARALVLNGVAKVLRERGAT